jgi:hypothetical protein
MAARNPIILDYKLNDWPAWIEEVGSSASGIFIPDQDGHQEFLTRPVKIQVQEIDEYLV